jgi:hypothetical protein
MTHQNYDFSSTSTSPPEQFIYLSIQFWVFPPQLSSAAISPSRGEDDGWSYLWDYSPDSTMVLRGLIPKIGLDLESL